MPLGFAYLQHAATIKISMTEILPIFRHRRLVKSKWEPFIKSKDK
jgi:hypothetical protein